MRKLTGKTLRVIVVFLSCVLIAEIGAFVLYARPGKSVSRSLNLGNKYLLEMNYEKAVRAFTDAIEADPMSVDAYIGRGDAYLAAGDYANAWSDYETAEDLSGRNLRTTVVP